MDALKLKFGEMRACVYGSADAMAAAAAKHTAEVLKKAVAERGEARAIFGTGNSQLGFIAALKDEADVPWNKVTVFHMDEYVGLPADHPASFRLWIRTHIEEALRPKAAHYIDGDGKNLHEVCLGYERLLKEKPLDLVCLGIGENGHIAFNDPPVADFDDPLWVKIVRLDQGCIDQQVGEGHFPNREAVPKHAVSLTVPALLAPRVLQVVVPDSRKADAVARAYKGEISTDCPASILRTKANAVLFLDPDAARDLPKS